MAYLSKGIDTTLKFCSALSDTMHVCRNKIGDGTLLSSIWDLSNGTVNLYFYHDYKRTVQFNISEELKKGDHLIAIEGLFPKNHEFEKLRDFKTPKNSNVMGVFIVASAGFFLLTSVFFLVQFFKTKENIAYRSIQLMLFPIGIVFSYYMVVLCGKVHVFYFPAPYQDPTNVFVSMTSYLPFVLLLLILPFVVVNFKIVNGSGWSISAKLVFTLNNLIYFVLIGLFAYWKFFNVCS